MASLQNIGINGEKIKAENERLPNSTGMSKEITPAPALSKSTRETYYFNHSNSNDAAGSAQSEQKPPVDAKELQLQNDKEEKIRMFREQQEGERVRKMRDLEQQFLQAKKHREQQEQERKRRIEEARIKELERRQQVEERKRQIWEAEQERKEAILRRNMEREARIEARRNAQRNSQCFAFGSSTPRTFDLDLAAIGVGRNSVLMSSVSRRSEERELGPPRATSACSLDRKFAEDCMSRSMVSLSSSSTFRGRKRTDIAPTLSRERSITPNMTSRGNHAMRAVSMTRLDQLAQPRRTYRSYAVADTTTSAGPGTTSPSMSKSMCNLANSTLNKRGPPSSRKHGISSMSRSMLHLAPDPSNNQKENRRFTPSPTQPKFGGMKSAQSMVHLAGAPRLTRAARLRADALARNKAVSAWNLNKAESGLNGNYLSPGKDTSRSPSRPQSSMSGTSEISTTSSSVSGVVMRSRPAPRRPRPYTIAGPILDASTNKPLEKSEPERQARLHDRNVSEPAHKPIHRAKSVSKDNTEIKNPKPLTAPRKPVPPPKSTELLSKVKTTPVPMKDNLRKMPKPTANKSLAGGDSNLSTNVGDKSDDIQSNTDKTKGPLPAPKVEKPMSDPIPPVITPEIPSPVNNLKNIAAEPLDANTIVQPESKDDTISESPKSTPEKIVETQTLPMAVESEAIAKEPLVSDIPSSMQNSMVENGAKELVPSKQRITSEEEARTALAEKRRLAREQAEREAELERQRLEEIRRKEEEQQRLEEEEQRRMEEEQIRLAALHRKLEEEKLAKAIEEQQQREKEEQEKREEEAKQKNEREDQERKAREEAEKQRIELEEKLRKEEEERAERKRRVEQIMARTRGKSTAQSPVTPTTPATTPNPSKSVENNFPNTAKTNTQPEHVSNGINPPVNGTSGNGHSKSWETQSSPLPDILSSTSTSSNNLNGSGTDEQLLSKSSEFTVSSNRTLSANQDVSSHTNGYSSHEEMSCTTSPEDSSDLNLLIDFESSQQKSSKVLTESADFPRMAAPLDLVNNENYLINVDDVNSNLFKSANSFVGFEDSLQKKPDTSVTDLLS